MAHKDGWDQAKGYTDWRELFEKHDKELDGIFVATPDHPHFAPTLPAAGFSISLRIHDRRNTPPQYLHAYVAIPQTTPT